MMEAQVSVFGIDIAKSVFQVHAVDSVGKAIIRRRLKREEVETFFRKLSGSGNTSLPCRASVLHDDRWLAFSP
jgi:transposase